MCCIFFGAHLQGSVLELYTNPFEPGPWSHLLFARISASELKNMLLRLDDLLIGVKKIYVFETGQIRSGGLWGFCIHFSSSRFPILAHSRKLALP